MSSRTPCPHPIELRMFVQHSARSPEAESVARSCRALQRLSVLAARFAAEKPVQHTLADDGISEHSLSYGPDNRDPPSSAVERGDEPLHTIADLDARNENSPPKKASLPDVNLKASPAAVHESPVHTLNDDDLADSVQVATAVARIADNEPAASNRRADVLPPIGGDDCPSSLKPGGPIANTLADQDAGAARPHEPGRGADPWRGLRARSTGAAGATVRSESESALRSDSKSGSILGSAAHDPGEVAETAQARGADADGGFAAGRRLEPARRVGLGRDVHSRHRQP